ncbi:NAD(P)H-dependent oxidoreductase [Klebsiella grimontii]|uniref:NAD(P)H-dependent oxidoreductase n=1 Tax=Klebsiella grimontii TaxID=2058152 RepID=A0A839CHL1_9ENTR|nr:NAD(P)H-dependent oxidoreductase [Klebsiella grimontii]PLL58243.1 flavodoxin family protein [Klebsiella michiganensis]BAS38375.1 NAD(P)H dehydrogenase [Klebsiella oxytoca]MBA8008007.1 NAD(P)H-dependent oxidoreductase [Klebsiella grimontii]MBA8123687.1 NAD(P)H-dependent oxidoreductase [Klebsiella grimontii]MBZ7367604.1 NAD(P)H-dependent oxidoreductase [Klebsiella grimontii]
MHALIVVSHPLNTSLTHSVAAAIAQGVAESGSHHSAEIADLTREGFSPVFAEPDIAAFRQTGATPSDAIAEQARIDNADALVLVFPIYWWSMPGLLKGWIDRVFSNGWAYEETADGNVVKKLGRLRVHLVALGAASQQTYDKHGFTDAFNAQIVHGIFDYCGATVASLQMLLLPDLQTAEAHLEAGRQLGRKMFG